MKLPTLLEIHHSINERKKGNPPKLKGLALQNFTLQPLESYLQYQLLPDNFQLDIIHGGYDTLFQDSLNHEALSDTSLDFILIALYLPNFSKLLYEDYSSANQQEILDETDRIEHFMTDIIHNLRNNSSAPIFLFNFNLPFTPAVGIYDQFKKEGQISCVLKLNESLKRLANHNDMTYIIDINHCIYRIGHNNAIDWKYWKISKIPFSHPMQFEISIELTKTIRAIKGKTKKCLVLDCDDVLWGGILGELGWENIKLGPEGAGLPYHLLQKEIINLYNRGILIAICSKNNEKDVYECLQKNPNMLIQEKHLASVQANWNDKATNIEKIANDLNINLDSFVFMDDNPFEIEMINSLLPQVSTIQATQHNHQRLANCAFFESVNYTQEDKKRTQLYKEEKLRQKDCQRTNGLSQYLRSLDMKMKISPLSDLNLNRASQLSQRTNQFNLTTKRYSSSELKKMMSSDEFDILLVELSDKFGSYGNCGLAIISYQHDSALLKSFLLSCRVLGRTVETTFLRECISIVKTKGAKKLIGQYYPTHKNEQCASFYLDHGFSKINDNEFGTDTCSKLTKENNFIAICNEFNTVMEEK